MTTWASPTTPPPPVFFLTGWSSYSLSSPAYDSNNDIIPSPPCAMAHLARLWSRNPGVRARTGYLVSRLYIQCSKLFKCMKHTVLPMLLCTMINFHVIWLDYVIIIPLCRDIVILQKATWSNIHSLTPPPPPYQSPAMQPWWMSATYGHIEGRSQATCNSRPLPNHTGHHLDAAIIAAEWKRGKQKIQSPTFVQ